MNKKRLLGIVLSAVISIVPCLTLIPVSYALAKEEQQTVIKISNEEEWEELAKNCVDDSYSQNLLVQLENNLVFSKSFSPIPYFAGEFDGKGFLLSGIGISGMGSDIAVFRYLSETGSIRNLTVSASVSPTGTSENVGGIVSHNYGLIENCTFDGIIKAENTAGGIAACNEETGVIMSCSNKADIFCKTYAGGISGTNYGCILECNNIGNVNSSSEHASFESAGGIAGFHHGMINKCSNQGVIGYRHIGYNAGGIAGLSDGMISESVNMGQVWARKDAGGIVGQFAPYITVAYEELYVTTVSNSMSHITSLSNELAEEMASFEEMTREAAVDAAGEIAGDTISIAVESDDLSEFRDQIGNVANDMTDRKEKRDEYSANAQKSMDKIVSLTNQINREMNVIDQATDALEAKDSEDVIVDISTSNAIDTSHGYVTGCENYGEIQADGNVGGIVGTMDFDNTNDPENDIKQIGDLSLNLHATIQMVVTNCENYGIVHSVNENAAGIAGYMQYGYLTGNANLADVSSENSGYVAGIAAKSDSVIDNCHAHCVLTGESYVGGIVSEGKQVTNCVSIVEIRDCFEKKGAISASMLETCNNNYYISEELGGIDGISFGGKAERIAYDKLLELTTLSADFYTLKVTFIADNEVVKILEVPFDGTISESQIPKTPVNAENQNGDWEPFEKKQIRNSFVVHAVYDSWCSVISTDETIPLFLLEGKFYPDTKLTFEKLSTDDYSMKDARTAAHYRFEPVCEWVPEQEKMVARVNFEESKNKRYAILLVDAEGKMLRPIVPERDGRYFVFDTMDCREFYILEYNGIYKPYLLCGIGLTVLLLILLPFSVGIVSKKKGEQEIEDSIRKHEERKGRK